MAAVRHGENAVGDPGDCGSGFDPDEPETKNRAGDVLKKKLEDSDITVLLDLLGDDDAVAAEMAWEKLVLYGQQTRGALQEVLEISKGAQQARAREALEWILRRNLVEELRVWAACANPGLEDGIFLIARFGYPSMDEAFYRAFIRGAAEEMEYRFAGVKGHKTKAELLGRYLFVEQQFSGARVNYYDPDNSFINRVIDTKSGLPISTSALYLVIARRLGLPVEGIALPAHFLVEYKAEDFQIYVDPFESGEWLTREQCVRLVQERGHEIRPEHFKPVGSKFILSRMVHNLVLTYSQRQEGRRQAALGDWLQLLED